MSMAALLAHYQSQGRSTHLRRFVIIGTALALLIGATTAYAVAAAPINNYGASFTFSPKQAGSKSAPSALSFVQKLSALGTNGNRTATLLDIKTRLYGIVGDGKDFPTCSLAKIAHAGSDTGCAKAALVATGSITAVIGAGSDFKAPGLACDPLLHVWNGGQGKLVYFFVETAAHQCFEGVITTGSVGPYPGTYKEQGGYLVMDTPIPRYVDYPAPGQVGSLMTENLKWVKNTETLNGKTVASLASVGCVKGARPYSVTYTATLPGSAPQQSTLSGKAPC
jgi:hypothetical protein